LVGAVPSLFLWLQIDDKEKHRNGQEKILCRKKQHSIGARKDVGSFKRAGIV